MIRLWRSIRLRWLHLLWISALRRLAAIGPSGAEKHPQRAAYYRRVARVAKYRYELLEGRGQGDHEDDCSGWDPRPATLQDFPDCETDGHYRCHECARRSPTKELEEGL